MEKVPFNFCGIEEDLSNYHGARCVVLPVPYEATVTYRGGTARGPAALIDASRNMETFDEELEFETIRIGIHTLSEPLLPSDPLSVIELVEERVKPILEDGKLPLILGGEHSITLGPVRACAERSSDLSVLQIDAHADLRESYRGSPYSHACVGARIRETCPLVQVGIRSLSADEFPLTQASGIHTFFAKDWAPARIPEVVSTLNENVYVTIDLDGLDPSVIPGTGTPEPGGLSWTDVTSLLRKVSQARRVVGFDVVELSPIPGSVASEFAAARLAYKFLGYIARARGWLP